MSQGGILSGSGGGGGTPIETIVTDSGSISGSTVTIYADNVDLNCGSSVSIEATSSTVARLNVTDKSDNTMIGANSGNLTNTATNCTSLGSSALSNITDDDEQVALGIGALQEANNGASNTAVGSYALNSLLSGNDNTSVGAHSGIFLTDGDFNTIIGYFSGTSYTSSESSNVLIQHPGVLGESNVMRIGTTGSGPLQVSSSYLAGVNGVPVSTPAIVGINASTEQLGTISLSVNQQVFLSPGTFTYTPSSSGVLYAFVRVLGGGAGGGGVTNSSSVDVIAGSGGGGGGYTESYIPIGTIGASQTVVVGAGGTGVSSGAGNGGGNSSFGTLLVGNGGVGGALGTAENGFFSGGSGGGYSGGSLAYGFAGQTGGSSGPPSGPLIANAPPYAYAGYGGSCFTGRQNEGYAWSTSIGIVSVPGEDETEYGVGGSGGFSAFGGAPNRGGNGMSGFVIVTEYILS